MVAKQLGRFVNSFVKCNKNRISSELQTLIAVLVKYVFLHEHEVVSIFQ